MMTDKIMIDGVDVSGCEFFCKMTDRCLDYKRWYDKPPCKQVPDCHYKQLIRKTAENNELLEGLEDLDEQLQRTQTQYNAVVEQNKSLQQEFKRKEEECEVLRHGQHVQNKVIKELQAELQAEQQKVKELGEELEELKKERNKYKKQYKKNRLDKQKYKQALEEIKGMIQQEICIEECLFDWEKNCPDSDCRYNQILQKCEVLND